MKKINVSREEYQKIKEEYEFWQAIFDAQMEQRGLTNEHYEKTGGMNTSFSRETVLSHILNMKKEKFENVVVGEMEQNGSPDVIAIGDVVLVEQVYEDGFRDKFTFELTAIDSDALAEIPKISIVSPLGQVANGAKIGEEKKYTTNVNCKIEAEKAEEITVYFISKVNNKEKEKTIIR